MRDESGRGSSTCWGAMPPRPLPTGKVGLAEKHSKASLAFDAGHDDALHKVALAQEKDENDRQHREDAGRHQ